MGVRRLKTFLTQWQTDHPSDKLIVPTDLKVLAEEWSSEPSIIVMDSYNIFRKLVLNSTDCICRGDFKDVANRVEEFVAAFKAISVELVFIFDGPIDSTKLKTWLDGKSEKVAELEKSYKNIEDSPISEQDVDCPPPLFHPVVKETVSSLCTVITALKDHDKVMAQYVKNNNCLGIFSGDTDFLIFEDIPHIFSPEDFDVKSMKAKEYRREALLQLIDLRPEAMPIFATLMGNDTIDYHFSQVYLKRYWGYSLTEIVRALAKKSNLIYSKTGGDLRKIALRLSEEMFGFGNDKFNLILDSLESYSYLLSDISRISGHTNYDDIIEVALRKFEEGKLLSSFLGVMTKQRNTMSEKFADTDPKTGASHIKIHSECRRRIYCVLLQEKPYSSHDYLLVEEWVANFGEKVEVTVERIKEVEHPGLLRLWDGGHELDDVRWKLLWWIMCFAESSISPEEISQFAKLPAPLMLAGLAVLYICAVLKKVEVTRKEAMSFLITIAAVPELSEKDIGKYRVEFVKKRNIFLADLYQSIYLTVRAVFQLVGVQHDAKFKDAYSGMLFHHIISSEDPINVMKEMPVVRIRENVNHLWNMMEATGAFAEFQD